MPHVRLRDFNMHYVEHGAGDAPIVFVAGFVASHRWWLPALEQLPDGLRAYAIDMRGTGESEMIATGHTIRQHANDLWQFVDALGLERFVLVGHSLGGGVAMQYAVEHQERLLALALVSPLSASGTTLTVETTDWINAQCGQTEGIRGIVQGAFATPPTGSYLEQLVEDGVNWRSELYLGMMDEMARFDITESLSELRVPTLVSWGDRDAVIPFPAIVEIFSTVPGCGLEIWHGVGHSGMIEQPARFMNLLRSFLDEAGALA